MWTSAKQYVDPHPTRGGIDIMNASGTTMGTDCATLVQYFKIMFNRFLMVIINSQCSDCLQFYFSLQCKCCHTPVRAHTHTHTHTSPNHALMHANKPTKAHMKICASTHTRTHACTHPRTHTHTHTHTHTNTHFCSITLLFTLLLPRRRFF